MQHMMTEESNGDAIMGIYCHLMLFLLQVDDDRIMNNEGGVNLQVKPKGIL
jgi:hypothetical protein